ncbi:MAG: TVP38/TMEM64 family protein [Nitrospirota bacterium]
MASREMKLKKIIILIVIAGLIVAFKVFGLDQYLTLSYLKGSLDSLKSLYESHSLMVIASYFLIYVTTTSLSLPGASPLGIAGGALFGFWTATIVVSFASTIGATLACLVSRFLLRDWIQNRFHDRITRVNEGIEKEGAFYLFSLRLIPVFPFWLINLAMGLTKMPISKFYLVSQIGMLPGTMVFVNAGKELAKIESVKGIFSPSLIISFALIGIFPIAVKKLLALYRSRKGRGSGDAGNIE